MWPLLRHSMCADPHRALHSNSSPLTSAPKEHLLPPPHSGETQSHHSKICHPWTSCTHTPDITDMKAAPPPRKLGSRPLLITLLLPKSKYHAPVLPVLQPLGLLPVCPSNLTPLLCFFPIRSSVNSCLLGPHSHLRSQGRLPLGLGDSPTSY